MAQRLRVYPFLIELHQGTIEGKGLRSYERRTGMWKERRWESGVVKSQQHFR